jgi:hypothetical protein
VLKLQLQQYRRLIDERVADSSPIITYQDNMQLMRTSLRHLRLSKLQKDKVSQNKMWDFTVRGWRVADIEGLEKDFQSTTEMALEPQGCVSKLTYEELCIGKYTSITWYSTWHKRTK